ncbi:L-fucose:H+ symporter permease [Solimonas marina]|uniref:L-fucose:H+ symporter permease n=1 Tax=Solimonas marina TaxID=2714601 RepID=A0A969WDL5_9GAMM|nr:L-fucose:H+ symporter permease [Solimonas marina]NKF24048.1 L-fucose:H+ symporter permease [Solimonas marina]
MALSAPVSGSVSTAGTPQRSYAVALALVTSLFFMWGLSYGLLDVLNKHFQETLNVSHAKSGLLQAAYFGAYFLWALPASALMQRAGYKVGILLGLSMYAIGALLFVPATASGSYAMFLFALFVIASGLGCLETAANPYVTVLGPSQSSARRLNLSQSFNGLGQFFGPLIGGAFFFKGASDSVANAQAPVQAVYVGIAILVVIVAFAIWRTQLPDIREKNSDGSASAGTTVPLMQQRHFLFGVVTQFFYVAAQVGVGAFFINFMTDRSADTSSQHAAYLLSVAMIMFLVGRFIGTGLLTKIAAPKLLAAYGAINMVLVLVAIYSSHTVAVVAMIGVFFFMSIMFPTIFALGVTDLGANTKRGASFQIMAIVGGAIAPYVMGRISDLHGVGTAYLVPVVCFAIVCWYGLSGHRVVRKA